MHMREILLALTDGQIPSAGDAHAVPRPHVPDPGRVRNDGVALCALHYVCIVGVIVKPLLRAPVVVVVTQAETQPATERPLGPDLQGAVMAVEAGDKPFRKPTILRVGPEQLAFPNRLLVAGRAGEGVRRRDGEER